MAYNSSDVATGNDATALQYNNLRKDLIEGFPEMKTIIHAYRSNASFQSIASGSYVDIQNDGEVIDTLSEYDTTTYKFTVTEEGYYRVWGQVAVDNIADTKRVAGRIYKNGTTKISDNWQYSSLNASDVYVPITPVIVYLSVSDYITLQAYQNTGSGQSVLKENYQTFMCIERVLH